MLRTISEAATALAAILLLGSAGPVFAQPAADAPTETLQAAGLQQPVQIIKDRWGISHIYAKNEHDLFFGQGYNAARDRLFQFELWRRQANGTMAEIMGPSELKRDISNRLFAYRGDAKQDQEIYHPRGAQILAAFVAGVNAYIAETERDPSRLPPEFQMLGIKPGLWTTEIATSRFNALGIGNAANEIKMAQAVAAAGEEAVKDLQYFQNGDPDIKVDPAINSSLLSADILDVYSARFSPIQFKPGDLQAPYRGKVADLNRALSAQSEQKQLASLELPDPRADRGSNNWVVNGKLTTSGYPLVAGDPHRSLQIPSLRYWVHLNAPGWDVIGAGEPAIPGVSVGHNEFGAWGLTVYGADMEDLYVYDLNPANLAQYRYKGGWETMTTVKETVPVKGQPAQSVDLRFTRHGPVAYIDKANKKAYAIRAAWLEPGTAPYLSSLRMDQAKTVQDFLDASTYMRVPSENMIWGDREGNIAYQGTAAQPRRPNWSGLVPVPGDGRFEWAGLLPVKDLPQSVNPSRNYINTSNDNQIPRDFAHKDAVPYSLTDPYRGQVVAETLGSGKKFNVADMVDLQNSDYSIPARNFVHLLRDMKFAQPTTQKAADRLLKWDFVLDKNSIEAGIYEMFQRYLMDNVRETVVPAKAARVMGPGGVNVPMVRIIALVNAPDGRFGADPLAGRDAILEKSLDQAVADLTKRLGGDMEKWALGSYRHATIKHPLSGALSPDLEAKWAVGPMPRGGDLWTVTGIFGGDNQIGGGSFKIIMDTEDWDNSVGMSTPGQSGNPDDRHYSDLFKLWAQGRYFPVLYSKKKIEGAADEIITLSPK